VYQGEAAGLYTFAEDLGVRAEELEQTVPGLPRPWDIYDERRDKLLCGKRFDGHQGDWYVTYSIWRDRRGWRFRVVGDGVGDDPLDWPDYEEYGPFRTKAAARKALKTCGLNDQVRF
jgi:hypothetical protein